MHCKQCSLEPYWEWNKEWNRHGRSSAVFSSPKEPNQSSIMNEDRHIPYTGQFSTVVSQNIYANRRGRMPKVKEKMLEMQELSGSWIEVPRYSLISIIRVKLLLKYNATLDSTHEASCRRANEMPPEAEMDVCDGSLSRGRKRQATIRGHAIVHIIHVPIHRSSLKL